MIALLNQYLLNNNQKQKHHENENLHPVFLPDGMLGM